MSIPNVQITVANGGINNVSASPANVVVVFGCSSGGTDNTPSGPYYRNDVLVTEFGYGPGVEMVANLVASNVATYFVKVETTTPGDAGSVTHTGTGVSVMTVTGDPFDAYDVIVTVATSGTAGSDPEPTFTVSLDGGQTVSKRITMPANHVYAGLAASTGMTLNFTVATLVAGDTYTFSTVAPLWAASDVAAAITAFKGTTKQAALGYVVGPAEKADADTIAAAVNAYDDAHRFVRFILEARDFDGDTENAWMADISADYQTFENDRIGVAAGPALIPSAISSVQFRRNIGQLAIVRAGLVSIGTDLAKVKDGALLANLQSQPISVVYHDEALNPGLDANRFITVRSFTQLTGYYITNPNLMASPDSDYIYLQYGRVVDEVCRLSDRFFTLELSDGVQVGANGFIRPVIARQLQSGNDSAIKSAVVNPGDASFVSTVVSLNDDIISTHTLTVSVNVVPLGYIKNVAITVKMTNPANAVQAA